MGRRLAGAAPEYRNARGGTNLAGVGAGRYPILAAVLVSKAYANRNNRTAAGREDQLVSNPHARAYRASRGGAPNQAHVGIARVPDARVAKLSEIFKPKKITYATIEYVDIGGMQKDREKNSASLVPLREADALAHVVRLFENPPCRMRAARSTRCAILKTWKSS